MKTEDFLFFAPPLGFARGADLGSQTARRAEPRRESGVYMYPTSASLGGHSASLGVQYPISPIGAKS